MEKGENNLITNIELKKGHYYDSIDIKAIIKDNDMNLYVR